MTEHTESQVPERKKPGRKPRERSAAGMTTFEANRSGLTLEETRDPNAEVKAERVRVPLGSSQDTWLRGYYLDWDKFHYHLFHESQTRGGRVAEADMAFYEHCQINGENIKRPAGAGWDYLMRIPLKYYQEDMQAARDKHRALERVQNELKENEYTVDKRGKPVFHGEAIAHQTESSNPYA